VRPSRQLGTALCRSPSRLQASPPRPVSPPAQDFFSDGITEDVITALGRFSNLLVIAKSASFQFKGQNLAPAEIGRQLDAGYLLDGSVRRAGDRVRVSAELTKAQTGQNIWSQTYDAEVKDIFGVQEDIARRVAGAPAVKLTRF
jgi:adenylate cyclase